ncbi:PspC domain-containing protein [Polymorphospora rubra]|uniref:PspC domain-containing protein n=1 Tax=Polymorphospora rubra TaxID=338584 RepID=UPI003F4CBC4B
MTDEAAESRRPAKAEPAGQSQQPLPGSAPSAGDDSPAATPPAATPAVEPAAGPAPAPAAMPTPAAMPAPRPMPAPAAMPPAGQAPGTAGGTGTTPPTETPPAAAPPPADPATAAGPPPSGGSVPPPAGPPPGGTGSPPPGGTGGPPPGGPPPGGPPPWGQGAARGAFATRYGLVRPRDGRYLAGVCAAIGRATNTDPILWRVLLAVLGFFGGIGILVYVAAWLLIPSEGDTASPVESMLGRGRSSMSPVTVIVLGVLIAVMFGFIVTDSFRAVMLGTAILIGGALLLNRNSAGSPPDNRTDGAVPPGGGGPVPPYAGPAPVFPPGPVPPVPPAGGPPQAMYQPAPPGTPAGPLPPSLTKPAAAPAPPDFAKPQITVPVGPGSPAAGYPPPSPYVSEVAPPQPGGPDRAAPTAVLPPVWPTGSAAPVPAPPAGGYRPPFAPHGPYAGTGPFPPVPPKPVNPPKPPKPPKERSPLGAATFSMIFVVLGLLAMLHVAGVFAPSPSAYFAAVLATIALGLLVGAWLGRARWLIALGLVAAAALGFTSMVESFNDGRPHGDVVVWSPASHDALATRYSSPFGDSTLDLRSVDFSGQNTEITVDVNIGTVTVLVPPQVDVVAVTSVGVGDARVFGQRWSGIDSNNREVRDLGADGAGGGDLRLFVNINAGDVEVRR